MALNYKNSGVDYNYLDPVKKSAQKAGYSTRKNILGTGISEVSESRGETAYILESEDCYYATVQEGLGTKNLIADKMAEITGKSYYDSVAQDTVAAIVNDIITVGAKPLTVLAYWAVGDSKWFGDKKRVADLIRGWKKACNLAGCTWGGGETPSMNNVVNPQTINLAGSALGIIKPKNQIITGEKIQPGDAIIFFESNGIHANGLSLARKIADKIPGGYEIKLRNKLMYGEELLKPSTIYANLVREMLACGIEIHYLINVTGHGWKKIMRAEMEVTYEIDKIPPIPDVFRFIQQQINMPNTDMYATFNMGVGFAAVINKDDAGKALNVARLNKIKALEAGYVRKGEKQVVIKPLELIYKNKELNIRNK